MPAIAFEHITKSFDPHWAGAVSQDGRRPAVFDVTLAVEEGEFAVLLGPSGCGKTTLLRMVNRLIEPTSGDILIGETSIHQMSLTQLRRQIGYVIQQVGLFPHMNVAANIAVVPKLLGWQRERIKQRVDELLNLLGLPPDEYRKRYPRQLSGGQQQRVGIARAMAADPAIMLMDEPFGAIDAITRGDLQNELLRVQRKVGKTVIFVTHDVEEALKLADRIAIMRLGEVVQYDTPVRLLANPADDFVRLLLGADDVLRQLSVVSVKSMMDMLDGAAAPSGLRIREDTDVRTALSMLISNGADELRVDDAEGNAVGRLTLERVLGEASHGQLSAEALAAQL